MTAHSNPKTAILEVRTDRRMIADIAIWYRDKDPSESFSRYSSLLHAIISDFYTSLLEVGQIPNPTINTSEAKLILESLGFNPPSRSGRGQRALIEQLTRESALSDEAVPSMVVAAPHRPNATGSALTDEQIAAAQSTGEALDE